MDIKIKKEKESERHLDIPQFATSKEINEEYDKTIILPKTVNPQDTLKFDREETNDDLILNTREVTTEFHTDDFSTLEMDTKDLEDNVKAVKDQQFDRHADTIKVESNKQEEKTEDTSEKPKRKKRAPREIKINGKYLKLSIIALIIIVVLSISMYAYKNHYSEERFVTSELESSTVASDLYVYGESLTVNPYTNKDKFKLYDRESHEYIDLSYGKTVDDHLNFGNVELGSYYLFVNDEIVTLDENPQISYTTITRDEMRKKVSITTDEESVLHIDLTDGSQSEDVDILIDASQGDIQGFTASDNKTTEQELSLKYAKALQTELKSLGYNVALTRNNDEVPGNCNYQDTYCSQGRVAMPYNTNAKLYISIGFNGSGGSGFEINDTNYSSHTLSRLIANGLESTISASTRQSGLVDTGIYNKTYKANGNKVDYLYLIRETGGIAMNSDNDEAKEFNTSVTGSETIVIDLAYISESDDFKIVNNQANQDKIVKSIASSIDQYIKK